jgi:molybdopterin-guanine dinucleotide biosynthesis protein A
MNVGTAIVLLAGGLGSRLGANKPLQRVADEPLISRVIERVSGLSDELLVVIARGTSSGDYASAIPNFVRVINDDREGKSPLIGIVSALRALKSEYAVVLTCDIPFVNQRVVRLLMERVLGAEAAVPRWRTGHLEPLQSAYLRKPMLQKSEEALTDGSLSPLDAIRKLGRVTYISIEEEVKRLDPDLRTFFNVNTKEDLAKAEMMIRLQES